MEKSFQFLVTPRGYARGKGHHESPVHRNPYDTHDAYDAIRTQDADLAVSHTITDLMRVIWFRLASVRKRLSQCKRNFGFMKLGNWFGELWFQKRNRSLCKCK